KPETRQRRSYRSSVQNACFWSKRKDFRQDYLRREPVRNLPCPPRCGLGTDISLCALGLALGRKRFYRPRLRRQAVGSCSYQRSAATWLVLRDVKSPLLSRASFAVRACAPPSSLLRKRSRSVWCRRDRH